MSVLSNMKNAAAAKSSISAADAHVLLTGQPGEATLEYVSVPPAEQSAIIECLAVRNPGVAKSGDPFMVSYVEGGYSALLGGLRAHRDAQGSVLTEPVVLEIYSDPNTCRFVPHRVVTNVSMDTALVTQACREVEDLVERALRENHTEVILPHGLSSIIDPQAHPLTRRASTVLENFDAFTRQRARMHLQLTLSEAGVTDLSKITMELLEKLTGDQFAQVLRSLSRAYPKSTTAGALYFLLEKGTDKTKYNEWFAATCAQHNWDPKAVQLALQLLAPSNAPVTTDQLRNADAEYLQSYGTYTSCAHDKHYHKVRTLQLSRNVAESMLLPVPAVPYADVMMNSSSTEGDRAVALRAAHADRVPVEDPRVVEALQSIDYWMRLSLTYYGGEERKRWFGEVAKTVDEAERAETVKRAKKAKKKARKARKVEMAEMVTPVSAV